MENILDYLITFGMDVLVTIIGFWLALKGNDYQEKRKEINSAKQCINDLKEELKNIDLLIKSLDNFDEGCYIDPLKTPVWTGLKNTNKLQLLAKLRQDQINKKEEVLWYNLLFEVYERIEEFNKWCNLFTEKAYSALLMQKMSGGKNILDCTQPILHNIYAIREQLLTSNDDENILKNVVSITDVIKKLDNIK